MIIIQGHKVKLDSEDTIHNSKLARVHLEEQLESKSPAVEIQQVHLVHEGDEADPQVFGAIPAPRRKLLLEGS